MPNNNNVNYLQVLDLAGTQQLWNTAKQTFVQTVNGNGIDANGNVSISVAGDFQVNGSSILVNGVANINTQSAYNASTNKIATMADVPNADEKAFLTSEYNKTLNLLNKNNIAKRDGFYNNFGAWVSNNDYNEYFVYLKAGTYTISGENMYIGVSMLDSSLQWQSQVVGLTTTNSNTFTIVSDSYVGISVQKTLSVMLNEGSTALSYQAYNGEIVHQKDIDAVLLWKNANPNSSMGEITLTDLPDMSKFKYIIITYKYFIGDTLALQYKKIKYGINKNAFILGGNIEVEVASRKVYFASATSIIFYVSYQLANSSSSASTSNNFIIPNEIYGANID